MSEQPSLYYSRPTIQTIMAVLQENYNLDIEAGHFYYAGLHDSYYLKSKNEKFIFRLYRPHWRNADEIFFELELLAFLQQHGVSVAHAQPTQMGQHHITILCGEGQRIGALFQFVPGVAPGVDITPNQARCLALQLATMHSVAQDFSPSYKKKSLTLQYLLHESMGKIEPFIDPAQAKYLAELQKLLMQPIAEFESKNQNYGPCAGDINGQNFHIDAEENIYLFDFDQCGFGHRAFEIAKFFSSLHWHQDKQNIMLAFLQAYEQCSPLYEEEHKILVYYEIVAHIWVMAIHADNAEYIGHKLLNQNFWQKKIEILGVLHENVSRNALDF